MNVYVSVYSEFEDGLETAIRSVLPCWFSQLVVSCLKTSLLVAGKSGEKIMVS